MSIEPKSLVVSPLFTCLCMCSNDHPDKPGICLAGLSIGATLWFWNNVPMCRACAIACGAPITDND